VVEKNWKRRGKEQKGRGRFDKHYGGGGGEREFQALSRIVFFKGRLTIYF